MKSAVLRKKKSSSINHWTKSSFPLNGLAVGPSDGFISSINTWIERGRPDKARMAVRKSKFVDVVLIFEMVFWCHLHSGPHIVTD